MIYDCRLRTELSGGSDTPISLQIEKTIGPGMRRMCVTDHHDYDSGFCDRDFTLDIPTYLTSLRMLQAEYRDRTRTNIGIELGLQGRLKEYLDHFIKHHGDSSGFIIGSSHFAKSMDLYDPEYWNKQSEVPGFEDFSEASLVCIRDLYRIFDSFGHLDCAVRCVPHQNDFYDYRRLNRQIGPLLKILIENGKSLECNADGFKYGLGQPNPCRKVLMRYQEPGGEMVTIGSDAHTPECMGYAFDTCRELLSDCGCRYFTVYHGRKPRFIPLQPKVSVYV